ncbi:hypothetical protein MMC24_004303 [Lignoscripta atroalba]|nr:hypothetical protein [Lignoscripta atroalba]
MHFTKALFVSASFVVAALAQTRIQFTTLPSAVTAGVPTLLEWTGGDGSSTVTITLRKGDPSNLDTIATILQRNAQETSFEWTPSSTLANADDYALEISQGSDVNFSGLFSLSGGQDATSTSTETLPPPTTTFFSALSTSSTLAPSAAASSVSAVLSSLNGTLSSLISSLNPVVSVTTTISAGTGVPVVTANTTFVSATLSATGMTVTSMRSSSTGSATTSSTAVETANGAVGLVVSSAVSGLMAVAAIGMLVV